VHSGLGREINEIRENPHPPFSCSVRIVRAAIGVCPGAGGAEGEEGGVTAGISTSS